MLGLFTSSHVNVKGEEGLMLFIMEVTEHEDGGTEEVR